MRHRLRHPGEEPGPPLDDVHRDPIALRERARDGARRGQDRGRRMWPSVQEREHAVEIGDAEVREEVPRDARRGSPAIVVVRRGAQALLPDPDGGPLVTDEVAPAPAAGLGPLIVPPVRDGAGAADEHDAAAGGVPRVQRRLRVVRHFDGHVRTEDRGEDGAALRPIGLALTPGAREHDRGGTAAGEGFAQRRGDRSLRVRRREQVRAAARAAADDLTRPRHGEGAGLRPSGVHADDELLHDRSME